MVFHRILDFKTRLGFYPASYFLQIATLTTTSNLSNDFKSTENAWFKSINFTLLKNSYARYFDH